MAAATHQNIIVELSAVIVSLGHGAPQVVVTRNLALPSGPLETQHRKLEQALRAWVAQKTGLSLGYVEQLYTFADKDRETDGQRYISIGYLALARDLFENEHHDVRAVDWYSFLPWEDYRSDAGDKTRSQIRKLLNQWKNEAPTAFLRKERAARIAIAFPKEPRDWHDELVLLRYELLWEAGLIEEAVRSGNKHATSASLPGLAMQHDHRRILATGVARLRAKIKYRPVVFELLPDQFTLLELQSTVEALAGVRLHKQNFRRLIQNQGLVEETTAQKHDTKGRPAKLFSFRREVLAERAVAGTKLPRTS